MKKNYIGISSCLLGNKVRYDGSHKRNRIITEELSHFFEFQPFCPEVAIGLGTPRPTIRLIERENIIEVVNPNTQEKYSKNLKHYAQSVSKQDFDGFLFKKDSPTCGAYRVKVYHPNGHRLHSNGQGAFAEQFMKNNPNVPIEEEGRLNDIGLKNNFINRVILFGDIKNVNNIQELINFHTVNKFTLYCYNQILVKELGRLIANNKKTAFDSIKKHYTDILMQGTIKPPKKGNQINSMMHMMGFLKEVLSKKEKEDLLRLINLYNEDQVSIMVPLSILRFLINSKGTQYIKNQSYISLELNY